MAIILPLCDQIRHEKLGDIEKSCYLCTIPKSHYDDGVLG